MSGGRVGVRGDNALVANISGACASKVVSLIFILSRSRLKVCGFVGPQGRDALGTAGVLWLGSGMCSILGVT